MSRHALRIGPGPATGGEARIAAWLTAFQRVLGLFYLGLAALTWAWALGIWPSPEIRFDTVAPLERVLLATFAVLHPICAVGLWSTMPWGRVVWFMTVSAHVLAVFAPTRLVFVPMQLLLVDAALLLAYLSLSLLLVLARRGAKAREA